MIDFDKIWVEKYRPTTLDDIILDKRTLKQVEEFKDEIHSIYVRGSVANGQAIDNFSDIDLIIFLHEQKDSVAKSIQEYQEKTKNTIFKEYPFVTALELGLAPINYVAKHRYEMSFILKHMAICMYGKDLSKNFRKFTKRDFFRVYGHIDGTCDKINKSEIIRRSSYKSLIRSAFYIICDEVDVFTYDLYPIMKMFTKIFPETKKVFKIIMLGAISLEEPKRLNEEDYQEVLTFSKWLNTAIKFKKENYHDLERNIKR